MNNKKRDIWVDTLLGNMDLRQKIGQLMVFGYAGYKIRPHHKELVEKYRIGGFRIAQKFHGGASDHREENSAKRLKENDFPGMNTFDSPPNLSTKPVHVSPQEYAIQLNKLRALAMEQKNPVPIHYAFDQEGEGSDFLFNFRLFPYPMGLAATGDKNLTYRVADALAKQARSIGANMIHSPCLDVNVNPENPEIGPRAYSPDPDVIADYAAMTLKGFSDNKLIATGKHFPGRGDSNQDAHFSLPTIEVSAKVMREIHLKPFRDLIDQGLPAIMAAFTAYPGIGPAGEPAATSREIITGILREEMRFKGVITTDNIQMRGLLDKYPVEEAVTRSLNAGCDLVLCRAETTAVMSICDAVYDAVKNGSYSERQLDESVQRILSMRYDMDLHINGGIVDPDKAGLWFEDESVKAVAKEASDRTTVILKNEKNLLPVKKTKKVLLIEQIHHFHSFINNSYSHPGMLWDEIREYSDNISLTLINEKFTEADIGNVIARIERDEPELIITTSYYNYRSHACMLPLLDLIKEKGIEIIVVANTPYEKFAMPSWTDTGLVSFCPSGREGVKAIAAALFGKLEGSGSINFLSHNAEKL
ncbi:MAG: hypothetical protein PF518_19005 [Spirochaetaceae bacterium]|jgi:beta-N-acetylhexosaminidase|nr:hypothetical protein [Spirochaetaceae bacterium]